MYRFPFGIRRSFYCVWLYREPWVRGLYIFILFDIFSRFGVAVVGLLAREKRLGLNLRMGLAIPEKRVCSYSSFWKKAQS